MKQFAIRVGERELFETPRIAGPSVRLNVTLDDGLPEHVYVHAAEALQRALVQLLAYEGAGKSRSVFTHVETYGEPVPEWLDAAKP